MPTCMRTPEPRASRIPVRWRGLTLVETALVISIIGLIALSALAAYSVVVAQRHSTAVVADAAAVRAAVLKWAGGGPLAYPRRSSSSGGNINYTTHPLTLQDWSQLAPHLPHRLQNLAGGLSGLTLDNANPWQGFYKIASVSSIHPMRWSLEIEDIPCALSTELRSQLAKTNAIRVYECTVCSAGSTEGNICATYDE